MADLTYPSMSQTPPAAASRNDGGDNPETLDYDDMGNTDSAAFEVQNFDQGTWTQQDRAALKTSHEMMSFLDPDGSEFRETWDKNLGGGQRRGNSLVHIQAVARAAATAQRRMNQALGLTSDNEGPRLSYNMPMSDGQRRGIIREFKDALGRELMAADATFIRRAGRGIVNG
jgi:hypothetical protein